MNNKTLFKKIDIFFLAILPVAAALIALIFRTNYLITTLLFFGLGSIWFSYRTPNRILRASLFSVLLAVMGTIVLDYIIVNDNAWWSPTIFPSRLLGILPYEDFIWGILQAYFVIILYEHFLDKGKHQLVGRNFKYFIYFLIGLLSVFFLAFFLKPALLQIPFAYFWIGSIFFLLPSIAFLVRFPKIFPKFIKLGSYFLLLHIVFEFTALKLGNWTFPGANYIGLVNIAGFSIPIEEIVVWWLLFIFTILSWYEFFDDDQK